MKPAMALPASTQPAPRQLTPLTLRSRARLLSEAFNETDASRAFERWFVFIDPQAARLAQGRAQCEQARRRSSEVAMQFLGARREGRRRVNESRVGSPSTALRAPEVHNRDIANRPRGTSNSRGAGVGMHQHVRHLSLSRSGMQDKKS